MAQVEDEDLPEDEMSLWEEIALMTILEIRLGWISTTEIWDKNEPQNIWEESCCLHIKCTAANPLAALMKKWYLNSVFQPYCYYVKIYEKDWWDKYQP